MEHYNNETKLHTYIPTFKDLWFRQQMLSDKETMSYNDAWGGTIDWPEEEWKDWYDWWILNHENKRFYRYITTEDNVFIGEIAYHYSKDYKGYMANVIIYAKYRKQGYFVYINHTNGDADAFIPSMLTFPKKDYIIVNPDAISIKGIRTLVMMLGALPIPSTIKTSRNFIAAVKKLIEKKKAIIIYPEAHIWPYYTDIRDFKDTSFRYPYDLNAPIFTVTNIYKRRKIFKRPKIVSFVDGPFMVNKSLSKKDSIRDLRNQAYNAMKKNVESNPKYEFIKYIKVDDELVKN